MIVDNFRLLIRGLAIAMFCLDTAHLWLKNMFDFFSEYKCVNVISNLLLVLIHVSSFLFLGGDHGNGTVVSTHYTKRIN